MRTLQCFFLMFFTAAAAFRDVKDGRIPNKMILVGLLTGFCVQTVENGILGILWFLGGAGLPVLLGAVLYYFRMTGGGDIKLLSMAGGFLGIRRAAVCIMVSLLAGAVFSILLIWKERNLIKRFRYFFAYVAERKETGKWKPYLDEPEDGRIHFSLAVLAAVLCYAGGVY